MGRESTLEAGDVVNRTYEMVRFLGSGFSGAVWEARHLHLQASVALKMMHPEDRDNEHKASRFRAEAATLFRLQHQNVVRILDANETAEGLFFVVMELLAGETLTDRLARRRLHPLRALKYAYDVACGLDAAHEIGVVHRDVKPDNLFITRDDTIKILDFTAAKFFLAGLRTTEPASRVGTAAFMSPEHIEGTTTDARLDQYSLAMCVHCMMRGKHPFERHFANLYALMSAQSKEQPEPLAKVAGVPGWIDDLLAPALAKEVEDRYPTMAPLARAIHEAMRRLAREEREGRLVFSVPLGEPAIDVEGEEDGGRALQRVYVAPEAPVRHTTAPVMPAERVSVAPDALPDAPVPAGDFDSAITVPLPPRAQQRVRTARVHRTTTAPMMTTAPALRPAGSRRRMALLALALPVAGGLGWHVHARVAAPPLAAAAPEPVPAPSAEVEPAPPRAVVEPAPRAEEPAAPAPLPPAEPAVRATPAPPEDAPTTRPPAARAPVRVLHAPTPPRPREGKADPLPEEVWSSAPAPATAAAAASTPPAAVPAPTAAHRVFGSEN